MRHARRPRKSFAGIGEETMARAWIDLKLREPERNQFTRLFSALPKQ
jgi:hypothetical protein